MNEQLKQEQLRDRSRRIIRTDGTIEPVPLPLAYDEILRRIGAATGDAVMLRHLGRPLVAMIVDDDGYETKTVDHGIVDTDLGKAHMTENKAVRAKKPLNQLATALYHANCLPGTTHQIVGDVYIAPDEDFAE